MESVELLEIPDENTFLFKIPKSADLAKLKFSDFQQTKQQVVVVMSTDQNILEPFLYLESNPGKDIRSQLIAAFDLWIKVPLEKKEVIKKIIAMLHTASLLVDDVEDSSELRRGKPVAHKIFGVAATINSANFVYFLALESAIGLQNPRVIEMFTQELLQLHRGQGHEIRWRDTVTCPTEEEYLLMISNSNKVFNAETGGLLRLAVKLMQECGKANEDYVKLVDILGVHFQIRDDYINLISAKFHDTKGFAEDLTEGKFSFPIVHCIHHHPSRKDQLLSILRQRTNDLDIKKYAISLLQESGSLEYTRLYLIEKEQEARREVARLGGNVILEEILTFLSKEYTL